MNILRKILILALGIFFTISAFAYFIGRSPGYRFYKGINTFIYLERNEVSRIKTLERLKEKAIQAKKYLCGNRFNTTYCFLLDMRLPSGKNRFFVYNLIKDSIELSGLVTHGKGSEKSPELLVFSNTLNSNCTSLGKYKLGNAYEGSFGLSYKLFGMERTNSRAYGRKVVLHSYTGVPNEEVYPSPIGVSEGCPTVSPDFLSHIKTYMDASKAPILLWIYY